MDRLAEAAQVQDEREAIAHLVGLEKLFRNKKWFDVATAEQQIASRYILGRAAIYRMGSFGEG
jgi:spore cortex formation protein SpoVR/YcgB (stage V sporulation)